MLSDITLKFLKDLQKNNNKTWFENNRKTYQLIKEDFLVLTQQIIDGIAIFDLPVGHLKAKDCTFRINRDVRFSKNKSPYKNNVAAYFNYEGKKGNGAGYYLHIEPGKSFAAGGIWMPEPQVLSKIRQEIDYSFNQLNRITSAAAFKKTFLLGITGEALVRPPKGYDDQNPAIALLKLKSFIVSRSFSDAELKNKNFTKSVVQTFKTMQPFINFLNTAIQ